MIMNPAGGSVQPKAPSAMPDPSNPAQQYNSFAQGLAGNSQAQLGNQLAQLGVAQQGAGINYNYQLQGSQNSLANQLANQGLSQQQLGLSGQSIQAQQGLLGTQRGLASQQYGLTQADYQRQSQGAALQYGQEKQQLTQGSAASGVMGTAGYGYKQGQQAQQYGLTQAGISAGEQQAALGYQGQQAGFNYQGGSLSRAMLGLGIQQSSLNLQGSYAKQQAGLQQSELGSNYGLQQQASKLAEQGMTMGASANLGNQLSQYAYGILGSGGAMFGNGNISGSNQAYQNALNGPSSFQGG